MTTLEDLSKALNNLKARFPDLPLLAIPWMHVRHRIHPVQRELLKPGGPERGWADGAKLFLGVARSFLCLSYALLLVLRILWLRIKLRREIADLKRQPFDLVAKSWYFTTLPAAGGEDFYYGDLPQRLKERGARILLLCGNPRGRNWRIGSGANVSTSCPWRLPELGLVPFWAPVQMAFLQIGSFFRLAGFSMRTEDPFLRRVAGTAARACLDRQTTLIGLYHWMAKSAVKIWRPKAFVTPYEGHSLEICIWRGVKAVDPDCQTVGYQYTVLLHSDLALLSPSDGPEPPRPDVVLCLGPRTQEMLEATHRQSRLVPFGSFRFPARLGASFPSPQNRTVLVMPEGFLEEEKLFFHIIAKAARRLRDHRFILRCHPFLPFELVRAQLEDDPSKLPNVEVSTRPVEEDYARASVILYRGTASVLYAVLQGLKPVYLENGSPDLDPLFELGEWRERIGSVDDLEEALCRYARTDPDEAAQGWRAASEYIRRYAISIDGSSLDRFSSAVGLGAWHL